MRFRPLGRRRMIAVAVLALILGAPMGHLRYPGRALDPVARRDRAQVKEGIRLGMADRLLAQGTLHGETRQRVVKLLGQPSDEVNVQD